MACKPRNATVRGKQGKLRGVGNPIRRASFRTYLLWLLPLLMAGIPGQGTRADDPTSELRARIEALERQNQELRESIGAPGTGESTPRQDATLPPGDVPELSSPLPEFPSPDFGPDAAAWPPLGMSASWNHGLELATPDRAFRVHIGGRTQFDSAWFAADSRVQQAINTPYGNGVDFRRARLRVDGTHEKVEWAVEYDFVNSARSRNVTDDGFTDFDVTGLTDMWWTFTELPGGANLRIGNQKEPIGFEHLVSSRFLPFMERSFNQDVFYGGSFNGFTPGISIFNNYAEERGLWHLGFYKPTDNVFAFNTNSGDYAVTSRVTYLPWYEEEGRQLVHLGFSVRASSTVNERTRFRTRDAIRSGVSATWPIPADTGTIFADHQQFMNAELVAVRGPWTFQSEYLVAFVQDARQVAGLSDGSDLTYHGGYVQVCYFLTGEHDRYNVKTAAFDRVIPFRDATASTSVGEGGRGAWQVGIRYNFLDLNSQAIDGGILNNFALGLNWFLNPNMKIQFNYSATDRNAPLLANAGDGWIHAWGVRMAHDF